MADIKSIGGNTIVLDSSGIEDGSITTAKLVGGNVTTAKLADGAVTGAKLAQDVREAISISSAADTLMGDPSESTWSRRTSTGSGMARVESVQGAAVVWNQLYSHTNCATSTKNDVTLTNNGDGSFTVSGTASAQTDFRWNTSANYTFKANHRYLVRMCPAGGSVSTYESFDTWSNQFIDTGSGYIKVVGNADKVVQPVLRIASGATINVTNFHPMFFDLTQMFGAGNEPATVAEFEHMFPEAYYPYSAPTLKPVQIAGIASTDAQGGELDGVEWPTQTLRAAGSIRDELTAGELVTRVGVATIEIGEGVTFSCDGTTNNAGLYNHMLRYTQSAWDAAGIGAFAFNVSSTTNMYVPTENVKAALGASNAPTAFSNATVEGLAFRVTSSSYSVYYRSTTLYNEAQLTTLLATGDNSKVYAPLATPTTTPISPALPMTYKVEQGGTESIVVPEGEVSAAPVLTVAEGESAADLVMGALACIATPDGPIATANHAVGTYLTMGGKLYKVTSAIASGETIASGTNVTETTVMAELLALAN